MLDNRILRHPEHDEHCGCGHNHNCGDDHGCGNHGGCSHDHDELLEEDPIIQIVDEETGETYDFFIGDEFEHDGQLYYALVPVAEDEDEELVYVIGRVVEEDGDAFIETLSDEENEEIYEAYDKILEEYFENEDFDDEELED